MDHDDLFFDDPAPSPAKGQPYKYIKPADNFRPLIPAATSVLYLAITTPHTDKYEIHCPASCFSYLLPKITDLCSDSPSALDKLESLQYSAPDVWGDQAFNPAFEKEGFTTFVIEGQRGTYTVLEILREKNEKVREVLPAPVYTVTRHGPLVHTYSGVGGKAKLQKAEGVAATSTLVGSFVKRKDAQLAARMTMDLLVGEEKVSRIEDWGKAGKDGSGGVLIAMGLAKRWEVKVQYDDETLRKARESAEVEGADLGWRF
ncbi:hypothetical protein E8E11_003598 [Didymella keratinophila]|nr:hypothetical protein E8E11_003598 [Didymella keratinophila]